jgi:osmotically-inducible protein OsmY
MRQPTLNTRDRSSRGAADGKLAGIVSRANLVRALAMTIDGSPIGSKIDDRAIREKLLSEPRAQTWAEASPQNILVKEGIVHLWCSYISEREKRALITAAENIPGVRRVEDHMRPAPVQPRSLTG